MFTIFKPKKERNFLKIDKELKKSEKKNKHPIGIIENNKKVKKIIEGILEENGYKGEISCYSTKVIEILESDFKENGFINENNEQEYNHYKYKIKSTIEQKILFLSQRLDKANLIFSNKSEHKEKKRTKKEKAENEERLAKLNRGNNRTTFYLEDMNKILNDRNIDEEVLTGFFKGMIKHAGWQREGKVYMNIFDKLIKHPSFNTRILEQFIKQQMSKKNESNYVNMRYGDDIDLNVLKAHILDLKILKHYQVVGLATLPYISLWKNLIKNYFLTQHLIVDFLNMIFKNDKPEEKEMILNFINTKLSNIHKNPEIKYMIENYMNSGLPKE